MKQNVIAAYEFDVKECPLTTLKGKRVRGAEIDHLISDRSAEPTTRRTSGRNVMSRSSLTRVTGEWSHKEDRLETYIHAQLCKNPSAKLLEEYQSKIRSDWISFYHEVYADE